MHAYMYQTMIIERVLKFMLLGLLPKPQIYWEEKEWNKYALIIFIILINVAMTKNCIHFFAYRLFIFVCMIKISFSRILNEYFEFETHLLTVGWWTLLPTNYWMQMLPLIRPTQTMSCFQMLTHSSQFCPYLISHWSYISLAQIEAQ